MVKVDQLLQDNAKTALVLSSLPDGLLIFTADSIVYANDNIASLLGYQTSDLYALPLSKPIATPAYAVFLKNIADALALKPVAAFDTVAVAQAGNQIYLEVSVSPIEWDGQPAILTTLRENAQRQRLELALKALAKFDTKRSVDEFYALCVHNLAKVYDARYAFIGLLDNTGEAVQTVAVFAENAIQKNFTYTLKGTPCADILTFKKELIPKDVAALYPEDGMLIDMQAESYFGAPLITTEGRVLGLVAVIDTRPMNVDDVAATTLGVFASRISVEVSRQIASELYENLNNSFEDKVHQRTEELRYSISQAMDASNAKTGFITNMSHELRNPLNAILGFGQLLQAEETLSGLQREWLSEMMNAGQHLLDLMKDILDVTRIESGRLLAHIEAVPLRGVLLESVAAVKVMAQARGIRFLMDEDPRHADCKVQVERTRLKQILLNLLSNAVKYNIDNGQVAISCDSIENGFLRIIIADTGYGMTPEQLDLIFEPFVRFHNGKQEIEGTGIGMTITHHLITLMGGRIKIESSPGHGTKVMLELLLDQGGRRISEKATVSL